MSQEKQKTKINLATIQVEIRDDMDKAARLRKVAEILEGLQNSSDPIDLIILPELWGCGFFDFENYAACSEELLGPTFELLSTWAKKLQACFYGGSIVERAEEGLYNTSLWIDSKGELGGYYRKIHLWGYLSREPEILMQGTAPLVQDTEWCKFGLATCYDLRFPEQFRSMIDAGAEAFLIASAWPGARIAHWRLFCQARALENQAWLASCNCAGVQQNNSLGGHSMTVAPLGEIIAEASEEGTVLFSQMDMAEVKKNRETFPFLADRV